MPRVSAGFLALEVTDQDCRKDQMQSLIARDLGETMGCRTWADPGLHPPRTVLKPVHAWERELHSATKALVTLSEQSRPVVSQDLAQANPVVWRQIWVMTGGFRLTGPLHYPSYCPVRETAHDIRFRPGS